MKKDKKETFPKVIVAPTAEDVQKVGQEFYNLIGNNAFGIRICTVKEAIEKELPLRQAKIDYDNKMHSDIFICEGSYELIPESYIGLTPVNLKEVVFDSDKTEVEIEIGIQTQNRNDVCACNSGKKYKNCCIKKST
jgi:hypothetical protein